MKLFKKLLTGVLCCAVPVLLFSQDFSNKGKEFWISYSYHVGMAGGGNPTMTLYITSDVNTNYSVEIYGVSTIQSGTITAGQVVTTVIPTSCFINNEGLFTGHTIRVVTDKNSVVYAYITRSAVSGATLCLPTPVLGREYYSTNFTQISNELNSNSYFTIIAVEDNTTVEITPSSSTKNGWVGGTTYTVNLNKGQIYQVMGTVSGTIGSDLTGSLIKSIASGSGGCKRIAVFSGSGKISIGCGTSAQTSDNLYQQLYPTGSWGLKYLTIPSYNRPTNFFRIIRKTASTNVYLNGALVPAASFTNNYYQFSNATPNVITASEPISVAQYFTTQGCAGNGSPYDPDMIMLNPVEQNINNVTLVSSNLAATTNQQHHLHVIMRNGGTGISSFKLDGNAVSPASWVTHPGDPAYSYLYLPNVSQGYHKLTCDSGFNALAYGYADAESYGYSAGANVKDLYQFVSIINQYATVNFPATCKNTPFYFRIVLPYQPTQIQWVFGSALNAMSIPDVTINSPVFDSTWVVNGRTVYRYSLPSQYNISAIGTYPIKVVANNPTSDGCNGVQEIDYDLQVFNPPSAGFYFNSNGCVTSPINFFDTSNTGGRPIIQWNWNFGDAATSSIQNPSHTYPAPGSYFPIFSVITDIGCISDIATKNVILTQLPFANFSSNLPSCAGKTITFNDLSTVSGGSTIAKWYWDFGDGSPVVTATNNSPQIHTYTTVGPYNVTLKVETTTGCQSFVFTKQMMIYSNPVAGFIAPEVCLTDPSAPFFDTSKISVGNIAAWQWNFGDANANAGNPNTSTLQNPTHRYTVVGNYTATLIVTSNNGCTDTISQTFTVNGSIPLANFTVQNANALCSNKIVTIADASTVDFGNIVKTEIYWDWTNDPTIKTIDDVSAPGKIYTHTYPDFGTPATKTVTVRMISYSGISCLNVLTKTITLLATPSLRFDVMNEVCTNAPSFQITQAGITNGLPGTGVFSGPGVSSSGFFNPNTATAGVHTIRYTFTGTNNCSNYIEQAITVNPTPNAFAGPDKTVLEGGGVQLTPALNSGFPVTYTWSPPTGLSNANAPDPLASPVDDITYTLKVTSDKGCNTSDQVFVKVLRKPQIPNIFSPNGDGIHDKWVINFLESYPGCTVEVFNRYGQQIYYSIGYTNPWDGTVNGKPVPVGTYYYIVDPKNGRQKQAGYVDIVR
jgi:gliding motility-associated-like protein